MVDQPQSRPPRRRLALIAGGCLAVIVLLLAGLVATRIPIATWIARQALQDTPFQDAEFRIASLSGDRLTLENVRLEQPFLVSIDQIVVTFDPLDTWNGDIEAIAIKGLDGTLSPNDIDGLTTGTDDGTGSNLRLGHLSLTDSTVTVLLEDQPIQVHLNGDLIDSTSPAGTFDMVIDGPGFDLAGVMSTAAIEANRQTVSWQIADGTIERGELDVTGLAGMIEVGIPSLDGGEISVAASIMSQSARLDSHAAGPFNLDFSASIKSGVAPSLTSASMTLELGTDDAPVRARLVANLRDSIHLTAEASLDLHDKLDLALDPVISVAAPTALTSRTEATLPGDWLAHVDNIQDTALSLLTELSLSFDSAGGLVEGYASASGAKGSLSFVPSGDEIIVTMGTDTAVTGLTIAPELLSSLGLSEAVSAQFATPFDVAILNDEGPWRLIRGDDGSSSIYGSGGVSITRPEMNIRLWMDGNAKLLGNGSLTAAIVHHAELNIAMDTVAGFQNLQATADGRGEYAYDALHVVADVTSAASKVEAEGVILEDFELSLPVDVSWSDSAFEIAAQPVALISASSAHYDDFRFGPVEFDLPIRVTGDMKKIFVFFDDNGWVDLAGVTHPQFVVDQPASIGIGATSLPVLTLELPEEEAPVWDARINLAPPSMTVTVLDDDGLPAATVSGEMPTLNVHATQLIANYLTATAETGGGSLTWVEQNVSAAGLKTLLTYNTGLSPWPQLRLDIDEITDLAAPARFAPLTADVRVTPVWPQGDDVRLSLNIHAPARRYALNVEASYEPNKGLGSALIRLPPVVFEPDGFQPSDLSPMLAGYGKDVSGSIEVIGDVTWQAGSWASDLDLFLREISATAFGVRMERLNSVINFDNIMPPSTPPGQLIAIAGIDAGLPLRDALISLALDGDGTLQLESATMQFAGGEVTAAPARWQMDTDPEPLNLHVTGVDVGMLFALADMDDLTASGTLDGTIPVRLADGDVIVEGARLESRQPGELHYLPEDVPAGLGTDDASLDLVLEALSNFHYERLNVDLQRAAGGETEVGLHIAGSNPDLYDGYPIELNISLTGALDRIVRDSLAGYRIPDEIRERLSGF